jgi:23S rRNA (cytidine1920-2'-O)/16S rRNA (cytidine1409-2'-O)-methyltransferase
MAKLRVDLELVRRGLAPSRARAQALIAAGKVRAAQQLVLKASDLVSEGIELSLVDAEHPYVSRGGLKLEGALADLAFDVQGLVIADIGASTGGFTECVLRHGATRVYAIDVGRDQLHPSLRADARVQSFEGVNARALQAGALPEAVDCVLIDASFIGLAKLFPALVRIAKPGARLLALVKPQFEVGPQHVGKKGVVRDDALRAQALNEVIDAARTHGLSCLGHADCRIAGPEGNREIFALFEITTIDH